jgi:tryptophan synthase beta chain
VTFDAAAQFEKAVGIIPAPESAHAIRVAIDDALKFRESGSKKVIAFNLSGHWHYNMMAYEAYHQGKLEDYAYPDALVKEAMAHLQKVPAMG